MPGSAPVTAVVAEALLGSIFNAKAKDIALSVTNTSPTLRALMKLSLLLKAIDLEMVCTMRAASPVVNPGEGRPSSVIPSDYVTTEDGTGIVSLMLVPLSGADDFACEQAGMIAAASSIDRTFASLLSHGHTTTLPYRIERSLIPTLVKKMV